MKQKDLAMEYSWLENHHCKACQYGEARHKESAVWLYHRGALVGQVILRVCAASRCEKVVYFQIWQDKEYQAKGEALLKRRLEKGNNDLKRELAEYEYILTDLGATPDEAVAHLIKEPKRVLRQEPLPLSPTPTVLDHSTEGHCVPVHEVRAAIGAMRYGSVERVMFQMLFYTGCRVQELDRMRRSRLYGEFLYWPCGKNQKGWRKEKLPIAYLEELQTYWGTHAVKADHFFGVTAETFRGYFKHDMRRVLPESWQVKRPSMDASGVRLEYRYQLKGLRKDYQTLHFKKELDKWGDPGIAIEMTGRQMRYSTARISARHYVENFDALGINGLPSLDPSVLLKAGNQKRLFDFGNEKPPKKKGGAT